MRGWNIAQVRFCPGKTLSLTLQVRVIFLKHSYNFPIPLSRSLQWPLCTQNTIQTLYQTLHVLVPTYVSNFTLYHSILITSYTTLSCTHYQANLIHLINSRPLLAYKVVFTKNNSRKIKLIHIHSLVDIVPSPSATCLG